MGCNTGVGRRRARSARFGVTTVYLVLVLSWGWGPGGELRWNMGGGGGASAAGRLAGCEFEDNPPGSGVCMHATLFSGRPVPSLLPVRPLARQCHRQSPGDRGGGAPNRWGGGGFTKGVPPLKKKKDGLKVSEPTVSGEEDGAWGGGGKTPTVTTGPAAELPSRRLHGLRGVPFPERTRVPRSPLLRLHGTDGRSAGSSGGRTGDPGRARGTRRRVKASACRTLGQAPPKAHAFEGCKTHKVRAGAAWEMGRAVSP